MFLHSQAYFFQWCYYERNFKYQILYFQVCGNLVEENRMCQQLRGVNQVKWLPMQKAGLALPCSNLSSFASKFTVLQTVLVTLLGFSAPL